MATNFEIPLVNIPQTFQLALAGKEYIFTCKWNDATEGGWVLDIADGLTTESIVANIPVITGADLLSGLEYLGIDGQLFVLTDGDQFAVPTLLNLGTESKVYFSTEAVDA